MKKAKVISFINYKGGVAKTTSTYHIGCWLAQLGKNVLLIDIDPQTNLTFLCVPLKKWEKRKESGTILTMYKRFLEKNPIDTKRYIWKTPIRALGTDLPGIDLISCDIDLIGEDVGVGKMSGARPKQIFKEDAREFIRDRSFLKKVVQEVEDRYDYILIDCPPNLYLMTENALVASNYYVVTAIPDHLSTIGLNILTNKAEKMQDRIKMYNTIVGKKDSNSFATFGAILFVRVRLGGSMLTNAHADKMADLRNEKDFKNKCFNTYTTELIGYTEAATNSLPVWFYDSENARRATKKQEYPKITEELIKKFQL